MRFLCVTSNLKDQFRICERSLRPMKKGLSAGCAIAVTLALLLPLLLIVALPAQAQTLTTLWNFGKGGKHDGKNPNGGLVFDAQGNIYGTTTAGCHLYGVVFELSPTGSEKVLTCFVAATGGSPWPLFVRDASGNLYGVENGVQFGSRAGTVFEMTHRGP